VRPNWDGAATGSWPMRHAIGRSVDGSATSTVLYFRDHRISGDRMPSVATGDIRLQQCDDKKFTLLLPLDVTFDYPGYVTTYQVPDASHPDFTTDLASVPIVLAWLIPRYGIYTRAAIVHDYLCELAVDGTWIRRDADMVFRDLLKTEQVGFLQRWAMWAAVR